MSSESSQLAAKTAEGLGPGAALVTMVPATTVVLSLFALASSALYPWSTPPLGTNKKQVLPGLPSVVQNARDLGGVGIAVVVIAVICLSVLLRAFQRAAVQLLEGYWATRWIPGRVVAGALERHTRRRDINRLRIGTTEIENADASLVGVMAHQRGAAKMRRKKTRATSVAGLYPTTTDAIMPTRLGNVLRRAETTAGERYGLDTVDTYPRLYPFLSEPVLASINEHLDALDTAATFVFVFGVDAALSSPLLARGDRWIAVPIVALLLAVLSYFAAVNAARRWALRTAIAYDLHRFDMLRGMHLPLPLNGTEEFAQNEELSALLRDFEPKPRRGWVYDHGSQSPKTPAEESASET